jgi:hypothetical protein
VEYVSGPIGRDIPPEELRDTIIEWRNTVDQIIAAYRIAPRRGLVHGLQKDAIQNSWDAKVSSKGRDWKVMFELVQSGNRSYFTITDQGTTGLTGRILTKEEYEAASAQLPVEERWGRFEGLGFLKASGGTLGARGRGKFVFVGASRNLTILYDTVREDGSYRFGLRYVTKTRSPVWACDGDEGKSKIAEITEGAFEPLEVQGTRVIIVDPCEELLNALMSGQFMRDIEETWWEIIQKYEAEIMLRAYGKEIQAQVPSGFELPEKDSKEYHVWIKENQKVSIGKARFKIKKLQIVSKRTADVPDDIRAIAIQRGGMKICSVEPPRYVPWDIARTVYGFVTFDEETENDLWMAEDVEHYSFDFRRTVPNAIRNYIENEIVKFAKEKLGWTTDARKIRREMQREAEQRALSMINRFAREIGISTGPGGKGGKGGHKWKKIRLQTIQPEFPLEDTVRVNYGQSLRNISTRAINESRGPITVRLKLFLRRDEREIKAFAEKDITLSPSTESDLFGPFEEKFAQQDYPEKGKYVLTARIRSLMDKNKGEELDEKRVILYLEEDPPTRGLFERCQAIEVDDLNVYPMMGQSIPGEAKGYIFEYNLAHPAYKVVGDETATLAEYLFRLMSYEICKIDLGQDEPRLFTSADKENIVNALSKMNELVGRLMFKYYSEQ